MLKLIDVTRDWYQQESMSSYAFYLPPRLPVYIQILIKFIVIFIQNILFDRRDLIRTANLIVRLMISD